MIGPEGTAGLLAGWLTDAVPRRLTLLEATLPAGQVIPRPALVAAEERGPLGLEWLPALVVLPQQTRGMALVSVEDGGGEVYRITYAMRVHAIVRGEDHPSTASLQRRYALAIREALLERKQLRPALPGARTAPADSTVDPASIVETYSGVMVDDTNATLAIAQVDVDVIVAEFLSGPPALGTAGAFAVAEEPTPLPAPTDPPTPPRAVTDPLGRTDPATIADPTGTVTVPHPALTFPA